jgi:type II secretory pathway pseudopilin PulG
LELLVVLMVIGFVFALIVSTILGTLKIEKAEAAAYHRMVAQHTLADQFRADVASAASTPEKLHDWVKGPTCLILRTAAAGHIVYHWHDGKLERIEIAGKRTDKQYLPLGDKKLAVEFTVGTGAPELLTVRLKGQSPRPAVEISAALGGDQK